MPESFVCGAIDNYNSKKTSIDFKKFLQFFSNRESVVNKFSQRKTIKKVRCNWKILTRFIFSFRPSEIDNSHSTKRVIDPSVYCCATGRFSTREIVIRNLTLARTFTGIIFHVRGARVRLSPRPITHDLIKFHDSSCTGFEIEAIGRPLTRPMMKLTIGQTRRR